MAGIVDRIRGWFGRGDVEKATEAARLEDAVEREEVVEGYQDRRADTGAAAGLTGVEPTLPTEAQGDDLYESFQQDERPPEDETRPD